MCLKRYGCGIERDEAHPQQRPLLRSGWRAHVDRRAHRTPHEPEPYAGCPRHGRSHAGDACPFCTSMFEDGIKGKEAGDKIRLMDLSGLVALREA